MMATLRIALFLVFTLVTVRSQQIVDRTVIKDGETVTLTCDAGRAGVATTFQDIAQVKLSRKLTSPPQTQYTQLAQYLTFGPVAKRETQNPPDPSWQFSFTDAGDGTNNRAMAISVLVSQAKCSDAGLYRCEVDYFSDDLQTVMGEQNVTSEAGIKNYVFTWDPNTSDFVNPYYQQHMEDENVTITCRVDGPQDLKLQWMRGIKQTFSESDDRIFSDYPYANDITRTASPVNGNSCGTYRHMSILRLQLQAVDDDTMYKCTVMENGQEVMSGNLTIGIIKPGVGPGGPNGGNGGDPGASKSGSDDVGMIVGIVIGVLALIVIVIIIVVVVMKRRKNRGDKYEDDPPNAADHESNLHAPPPVFYSKPSKPPPEEKDNTINAGMTNEGLDTSYDSRDSAHKGPPRYANTAPDSNGPPRYEKETHRGRHNRGYDEEDRERNEGHGRRQERRSRTQDYDDGPRSRNYSTEDGTDDRGYSGMGVGDPSIGTAI